MTNYRSLNYIVPPRNQGQSVEIAYAITQDEIVRRSIDRSDGSKAYEAADQSEISGSYEPWNRAPSVSADSWTAVSGDDSTPE